jgi:hypothetical protein
VELDCALKQIDVVLDGNISLRDGQIGGDTAFVSLPQPLSADAKPPGPESHSFSQFIVNNSFIPSLKQRMPVEEV